MQVLVSDTSVLIDLERGSFLEPAFRLPFEFAVPDLLYELELRDYGGPALIDIGLRVEKLNHATVTTALQYFRTQQRLSLSDSFAIALSKAYSRILLTGDSSMRSLALKEGVECHGVLWLLDHLHNHQILDEDAMVEGLERIAAHPRCRLPEAEIRVRIQTYADPKTR